MSERSAFCLDGRDVTPPNRAVHRARQWNGQTPPSPSAGHDRRHQPGCRWLGVRCSSWMSRIHLAACRTRSTADTSGIGMGSTLGTSPRTVSSSALTAITCASFAMKTASASNTAMRASEGAPGRPAQTVPALREAIGRPEQSPADGLTSTLRADQRLSAARRRSALPDGRARAAMSTTLVSATWDASEVLAGPAPRVRHCGDRQDPLARRWCSTVSG